MGASRAKDRSGTERCSVCLSSSHNSKGEMEINSPPVSTLRGPKPLPVELIDEQHDALQALLRRHATPQQIALRARIVLAAAEGHSNARIAQSCGVTLDTVRLWRARWMAFRS